MTVHAVSTAVELKNAFLIAQDGDRIELAAGEYGKISLSGRSFENGITITSADPNDRAVLRDSIWLTDSAGVVLTGFDILATELAPEPDYARLVVKRSQDIDISDIIMDGYVPVGDEGAGPESSAAKRLGFISGYGADRGLQIGASENVHVSDLEIRDMRLAIGMNNSTGVMLEGMDIHRVREGINMQNMIDLTIQENHFHDFKPWWFGDPNRHDHPDMIQFWANGGKVGMHDIVIRGNLFEQGGDDGWTQTIYGNMGASDATATGFQILDNTIVNSHLNAISLYHVEDSVISGNLLLPSLDLGDNPAQVKTPGIVVLYPGSSLVSGNTFLAFQGMNRPIKAAVSELENGKVTVTGDNILLSTDPDDPLFWKNFLDGRVAVATDTGEIRAEVVDHMADLKGMGLHGVSYDNLVLGVTQDGWKALAMEIEVTKNTVLSFDFLAGVEGEIHAVAFANGNTISQKHVFQLLGTQTYGQQAYAGLYEAGTLEHHYEIAVGDFFTGEFDRLVFISDDDKGGRGDSSFINLALTGAGAGVATAAPPGGLQVNGQLWAVGDYLTDSQGTGGHELTDGGNLISVTRNAWKSVEMDIEITKDTVLSFDFFAEVLGEIHGIGFAKGDVLQSGTIFQLLGSQVFGLQAFDELTRAGNSAKHYDIKVGDYFTGEFDRLVFVMDDDAGKGADSNFGAITITGGSVGGTPIAKDDGSSIKIDTGGDAEAIEALPEAHLLIGSDHFELLDGQIGTQDKGVAEISEDGRSVTVTNNGWKAVELGIEITEDTVLSFDFASDQKGEIHGIGFSNGDEVPETYFHLFGGQGGGITVDQTYVQGSGLQHYDIAVGEYFTGQFDHLVFIMDQDRGEGADSTFANIDIA